MGLRMKRTKGMNKSRFRKSFLGIAVAAVVTFTISGCEQADETVKLYMNSEQCAKESGNTLEQCQTAEKEAQKVAAETAPKFGTYAECYEEFGNMCQHNSAAAASTGGESPWMPLMMGYMLGNMMGSSNSYHAAPMYQSRSGQWVDNKARSYDVKPGKSFKVTKSAINPKVEAPRSTWSGSKSSFSSSKTTTRGGFGSSVGRSSSSFGG